MKCQAAIQDNFGNKYKCFGEAVSEVTVTTFVPHLQKHKTKSKCLCGKHRKRYVANHKYRIKHLHKDITIKELRLKL